jgi:transposase InsO family protein
MHVAAARRDECFSRHWFARFGYMRSLIDTRREDRNEQRLHSAWGYQPPANFATALLAAQQTTGRTALSSNIGPLGFTY